MNAFSFPLIAFLAGAAIATQAAMNSQLGMIVKNSLLATVVAFFSSLFFTLIALLFLTKKLPSLDSIREVPYYLWFSGGLLSAFGIGTFYWLIPKMGAGPMVSYALVGQLILAMIAGHYGWFQLPVIPLSTVKVIGIILLISGITLVNKG